METASKAITVKNSEIKVGDRIDSTSGVHTVTYVELVDVTVIDGTSRPAVKVFFDNEDPTTTGWVPWNPEFKIQVVR